MTYTVKQRATDWQFVWATAEGRRAIANLLAENGHLKTTFDPNPSTAAYSEGRRAVVIDIVAALAIPATHFSDLTEAIQELEE